MVATPLLLDVATVHAIHHENDCFATKDTEYWLLADSERLACRGGIRDLYPNSGSFVFGSVEISLVTLSRNHAGNSHNRHATEWHDDQFLRVGCQLDNSHRPDVVSGAGRLQRRVAAE